MLHFLLTVTYLQFLIQVRFSAMVRLRRDWFS